MDFDLTDDQQALAGLVRAIVSGRFGPDRVRRHEGRGSVVDGDDWAALGEAGVFALTVPEADGGVGLGLADAAVVFEELGRGLVPGPLVAAHLAARLGAATPDGAADGRVVVGSATLPDTAHGGEPALLIDHFDALDALVVLSPTPSSLALLGPQALADLRADPAAGLTSVARPLDPLTPLSRLADPAGLVRATTVGDAAAAAAWRRDARVLTGALCVGLAAATTDLAVDYAKGRQQFGRPIGSFQAVKHLCADMAARAELARAGVQAAAVCVDQPDAGDADRLAAGGALVAAEAALANARSCLQVHGGMGFTWDVPVHLYLMRAKVLASSLGPLDALAADVAAGYATAGGAA